MITQKLSFAELKMHCQKGAKIYYQTNREILMKSSTLPLTYRLFGMVIQKEENIGFEARLTPSEYQGLQEFREKKKIQITTKEDK